MIFNSLSESSIKNSVEIAESNSSKMLFVLFVEKFCALCQKILVVKIYQELKQIKHTMHCLVFLKRQNNKNENYPTMLDSGKEVAQSSFYLLLEKFI